VRVQDLRVVARTSAFAFKDTKVDVREIGQKLNVDTVLEGSVRTFGNRLRVTAQLISVADGFHLWSERFDRELVDVFAIQDEISLALVARLKGELLAGEEATLRRHSTADHEAYSLYLKGLHLQYRPDPESLARASAFFQDAVAKDPDFALAHAGIATVCANLGILNLAPPALMLHKAKASLLRALELDPNLAEAHLGAANLAFWFEWDWEEAERSLERALALNPGNAVAYGTRAFLRLRQLRFDDAIRDIDEALWLDPLKPIFYVWSTELRAAAGRLDEALSQFFTATELDPHFGLAYFHAGVVYIKQGRLDEAIRALEKGKELVLFPGWAEGLIGLVSLKMGDAERASRILQEMIQARGTSNVSATSIAWLAAALGRYEEAFAWLEKAYVDRDVLMVFLHVYTKIFSVQVCADPRYEAVLRKMRNSSQAPAE
jgi:adenylate cyclase